ncbi:MAG: RNA recognition motif domain-containing protein [Anaerolineae bacterium]|jgi:cold-inducible RNA-binding protein
MSKRIYCGNLSYDTTSEGLRAAFEAYGEVEDAAVITDRETGRSRGFGFVTMADDNDALAAIEQMDGADLDGRRLRVNEAQPRPSGGSGYSRR